MSFVNQANRILKLKILYFGPGLSGKTTNIQYIYESTRDEQRGKMVNISGENERTLFFDFLPLSVGKTRGFETTFHLFSIPGQTFYEVSRQFLLKGADGLIFVVDSQSERMEDNIKSFELMEKSLDQAGYDINRVPLVFQYNKRDLADIVPVRELEATFNPMHRPYFEAVANRGIGVMETLQSVSQGIIQQVLGGEDK